MPVPVERRGTHPIEKLAKRRVVTNPDTQRQPVQEIPDQRLQLGSASARDRHANDDIVLTGIPGQQRDIRGQQRHVQRGVLFPREVPRAIDGVTAETDIEEAADGGALHRARPVQRKVEQRGRAVEVVAPVAGQPFEVFTLDGFALPCREISVLDRQVR